MDIFGSRSFLLVEDFEAMRSVLRSLLRRCGAQRVDAASSGREAANLLGKKRYDVVLCDYNLGAGKNGQMLLEEARAKRWITPGAVWIMITAEKSPDMISVAAEHAPDDYLLKPITEGTLHTRLQRLVERKGALADIVAAMEAKDYARALDLCRQRLVDNQKYAAEVLRLQAQLYQLTGDDGRARAVYQALLSRADVAWAKLGLAKLELQGGDARGARTLLEDTVRAHPQYLQAYDCLATVLEQEGLVEQQLELLQRATRISPNSASRQTALGGAALRSGQHELAAQAYQRSIKLNEHSALKSPEPFLGLARVQADTGMAAAALQTLAEISREFDGAQALLLAKAEEVRVHVKAGNAAAAAAAAQEVRERSLHEQTPVSADALLQIAQTLMEARQSEAATELLQFVARNHPEDDAIAGRAQRVFDQGGMAEAGCELLRVSRRQATEATSEGVQLIAKGELEAALRSMRQARALMPQNSRVLLNLAYVAITCIGKSGRNPELANEAREAISAAQAISPGEARAAELLARLESLSAGV